MRGDAHLRCGGRAGETGREQCRYRAPVRPLHAPGACAARLDRHPGRGLPQVAGHATSTEETSSQVEPGRPRRRGPAGTRICQVDLENFRAFENAEIRLPRTGLVLALGLTTMANRLCSPPSPSLPGITATERPIILNRERTHARAIAASSMASAISRRRCLAGRVWGSHRRGFRCHPHARLWCVPDNAGPSRSAHVFPFRSSLGRSASNRPPVRTSPPAHGQPVSRAMTATSHFSCGMASLFTSTIVDAGRSFPPYAAFRTSSAAEASSMLVT